MYNPLKAFRRAAQNWLLKEYRSDFWAEIMTQTGVFSLSNAEKLSAVYRAVEATANAVASLPFEPYLLDRNENRTKATTHYLYDQLNKTPNQLNSRFILMQMIVRSLHYDGNAIVEIERDIFGKIKAFWFLPWGTVQVRYDEISRTISYYDTLRGRILNPDDVIHIINYTRNGYIGVSTLTHAIDTLNTAHAAESHAANFFASGAAQSGIMTVQGNASPEKMKEAKENYAAANSEGGGISFIPGDMKYTPLSINAKDAQLLETRKFSVIEIARFFNIPPTKLFDDSQTKYDNVEAANLTFLADTVLPLAKKIALEFDRKIGLKNIETAFDTNKFLDADKDSQANYFLKLAQVGAITPNEIRKQIGNPPVTGGDEPLVQVNMTTIKKIINEDTATTT